MCIHPSLKWMNAGGVWDRIPCWYLEQWCSAGRTRGTQLLQDMPLAQQRVSALRHCLLVDSVRYLSNSKLLLVLVSFFIPSTYPTMSSIISQWVEPLANCCLNSHNYYVLCASKTDLNKVIRDRSSLISDVTIISHLCKPTLQQHQGSSHLLFIQDSIFLSLAVLSFWGREAEPADTIADRSV